MLNRTAAPVKMLAAGLARTALIALLTVYCQMWSGEGGVPLSVSLEWALVTTGNWLLFAAGLWFSRKRLIALVEGGHWKALTEAVGAIFALALSVTLFSALVWNDLSGGEMLDYVLWRLTTLSPVLLLLAVAVTACLAAWSWSRSRAPAAPGLSPEVPREPGSLQTWLELPEAPLLRLKSCEVAVIRTAKNYCEMEVAGRPVLVRITAKRLEERLRPLGFARIHRGAIVNLARVRMVRPGPSGRLRVLLDDGSEVAVSRRHRDLFARRLMSSRSADVEGARAA